MIVAAHNLAIQEYTGRTLLVRIVPDSIVILESIEHRTSFYQQEEAQNPKP